MVDKRSQGHSGDRPLASPVMCAAALSVGWQWVSITVIDRSGRTETDSVQILEPAVRVVGGQIAMNVDARSMHSGESLRSLAAFGDLVARFWAIGTASNHVPRPVGSISATGWIAVVLPPEGLRTGRTPYAGSCLSLPMRFSLGRTSGSDTAVADYLILGSQPMPVTGGALWSGADDSGTRTGSLAISLVRGSLILSGRQTSFATCP